MISNNRKEYFFEDKAFFFNLTESAVLFLYSSAFLTPSLLLCSAVSFSSADAAADLSHQEAAMAQDCRGYGVAGKVLIEFRGKKGNSEQVGESPDGKILSRSSLA